MCFAFVGVFHHLCVSMQLYINTLQENYTLKEKLQEMELLLSQNKVELERLRQVCVCV